jgi:hypothetical protein
VLNWQHRDRNGFDLATPRWLEQETRPELAIPGLARSAFARECHRIHAFDRIAPRWIPSSFVIADAVELPRGAIGRLTSMRGVLPWRGFFLGVRTRDPSPTSAYRRCQGRCLRAAQTPLQPPFQLDSLWTVRCKTRFGASTKQPVVLAAGRAQPDDHLRRCPVHKGDFTIDGNGRLLTLDFPVSRGVPRAKCSDFRCSSERHVRT